MVAERITRAAARCTRARRLWYAYGASSPSNVPFCCASRMQTLLWYLHEHMYICNMCTQAVHPQSRLRYLHVHMYMHAVHTPCTCRAGMPRAMAGVRTGARAWGQARTQARAGAAWGLRPGLGLGTAWGMRPGRRLGLALQMGLSLRLGLRLGAGAAAGAGARARDPSGAHSSYWHSYT